MRGRRKNQETLVSSDVYRKIEGSVSNAADDNQELTVEFNNMRLLVILVRAVLFEWWDKFFLGFKKNVGGETFETVSINYSF